MPASSHSRASPIASVPEAHAPSTNATRLEVARPRRREHRAEVGRRERALRCTTGRERGLERAHAAARRPDREADALRPPARQRVVELPRARGERALEEHGRAIDLLGGAVHRVDTRAERAV